MNILTDRPEKVYKAYLLPTMGSLLAVSIYCFADAIVVGQYEGPVGSAAMAVMNPVYGVMLFAAFVCALGGSVLLSHARGEGDMRRSNEYFTLTVFLEALVLVVLWILFVIFMDPILVFCGSGPEVFPVARAYGKWIIWFFPLISMPDFLQPLLRCDGSPGLAMWGVIIGGGVNMVLDYFFVFGLDMGAEGAAFGTLCGMLTQTLIMLTHFFRKRCRYRLVRPRQIRKDARKVLSLGFSTSVLDLGTVALTVLANNQMLRYGGEDALAVFGMVATVSLLFQALFNGVGQTIQPLVSTNVGAGKKDRIRVFLKLGLQTVLAMSVVFLLIGELFPTQLLRLFMTTTPEVLAITPLITRLHFVIFPFMGVNLLASYFMQSMLEGKASAAIALARSVAVSGAFLIVLPLFFGKLGVYSAMPAAEIVVAAVSARLLWKKYRELG